VTWLSILCARPPIRSALHALSKSSLRIIYVKARGVKQVNEACKGLVGIYPSRDIALVLVEGMVGLLQIKMQEGTVTLGSWVRIKCGKYQGGLAQVLGSRKTTMLA
jgi:transcription elongation factor SPT5